jgi:hypothetical protein
MALHETINHVIKELFIAEERRLNKAILSLEELNSSRQGKELDGFLLNGIYYRPIGRKTPPPRDKPTLHYLLWDAGDSFLKDRRKTDENKQMVRQAMVNSLEPARTLQDYRDSLPECLVFALPQLQSLSRTREEGCLIEDRRKHEQFIKALPLMEMLSVTRLIY